MSDEDHRSAAGARKSRFDFTPVGLLCRAPTDMGYKSRAKKRAANHRAIGATKQAHRETIAGRWYLTIVKRKTCCARCAGILSVGGEMVYRHTPREARCRACAELDPKISARPSTSWEKSRPKRKADRRAY